MKKLGIERVFFFLFSLFFYKKKTNFKNYKLFVSFVSQNVKVTFFIANVKVTYNKKFLNL